MPDKRLIDANALEAMFLRFHMETDPLDADWFTPYLFVQDAPTIDAVEVVRCMDCAGRKKNKFCIEWLKYVPDDGFCHKGAKMDGGADK